jgi:leucyl aminopeptidase (aminopeptidase T)
MEIFMGTPTKSIFKSITGAIAGVIQGFGGQAKSSSMIAIANTIVELDRIFSQGSFTIYPSENWVTGVSKSMGIFMSTSTKTSTNSRSNYLISLANSILVVDQIFSLGNFNKYPSKDWVTGINDAIFMFIRMSSLESFEPNNNIKKVLSSMVEIAKLLNSVDWNSMKYPSNEWVSNISEAIDNYIKIQSSDLKINGSIEIITENIVGTAKILSSVDWNTMKYPNKEWVSNVSEVIKAYLSISAIEPNSSIEKVLDNIVMTANKLDSVNWNSKKFPSKEWVDNVSEIINSYLSISAVESSFSPESVLKNIIKSANQLDSVNWNLMKYPSKEWVSNVSEIIKAYLSMSSVEPDSSIEKTIDNVIDTANKLDSINWGTMKYPSKEWVSSISEVVKIYMSLSELSTNIDISSQNIEKVIESMIASSKSLGYIDWSLMSDKLSEISEFDTQIISINKLSESFASLANSISSVNANLQQFVSLSRDLTLTKSGGANLKKSDEELSIVNEISGAQANLLSKIKGDFSATVAGNKEEVIGKVGVVDDDFAQKSQFYNDISEIKSLLYEFRDSIDRPSQAGSFINNY